MAENKNQNMMAQWFVGGALLLVAIFLIVAIVLVLTQATEAPLTEAGVDNVAPTVDAVVLSTTTISDGPLMEVYSSVTTAVDPVAEGVDSGQALPGLLNGNKAYYINGAITDPNGDYDFFAAPGGSLALTTYLNDGVLTQACTVSGTNCYRNTAGTITTLADPALNECSLSDDAGPDNQVGDTLVVFSCRFDYEHYVMSTAATGVQPLSDWAVYAVATDSIGASSAPLSSTGVYEVSANLAGSVWSGNQLLEADKIKYSHSGALAPGATSTDGPAEETQSHLDNYGNVYATLTIDCGLMLGATYGDGIQYYEQHFGLDTMANEGYALKVACEETGTASTAITLAPNGLTFDTDTTPKNSAFDVFTNVGIMNLDVDNDLDDYLSVFWGINIPNVMQDTYTGTNNVVVTQYTP